MTLCFFFFFFSFLSLFPSIFTYKYLSVYSCVCVCVYIHIYTHTHTHTIPARTIMDVDYTDDIALLANTPAQAESLLHSLEKTVGGIGPHVTADKTKYMCFNQNRIGDISTKRWFSETSGQVHIPQKQHLIYQK